MQIISRLVKPIPWNNQQIKLQDSFIDLFVIMHAIIYHVKVLQIANVNGAHYMGVQIQISVDCKWIGQIQIDLNLREFYKLGK